MANNRPTAPLFSIQLDRERHLRFDFLAAWKFEEKMGRQFFVAMQGMAEAARAGNIAQISIKDFVHLLWSGLVHEDPELKPEDVGAMIHMGNLNEVMGSMIGAQSAAAPRPEDAEDSRPPEAQPNAA